MSRKNNIIWIQTFNNNNYSAVGNPYTLDQMWQVKERVEQDRMLWIILPEAVNTIRKLRIQKRKKRGKRGGVKVHQAISEEKISEH